MIRKAVIAILISGLIVNAAAISLYLLFHGLYSLGSGNVIYRPSMFSFNIVGASFATSIAINFTNIAIFVLEYAILYRAIPKEGIRKGIIFGIFVWIIGVVIPLSRVYLTANITVPVFIYWMGLDLVSYLLMGAVTGAIYKTSEKQER